MTWFGFFAKGNLFFNKDITFLALLSKTKSKLIKYDSNISLFVELIKNQVNFGKKREKIYKKVNSSDWKVKSLLHGPVKI